MSLQGKIALVTGASRLDVDGRGVDQHRAAIRRGEDTVVQEDLADIGADRQHGDDEVDALGRVLHGCRPLGARLDGKAHRLVGQIVDLQAVARLDQIARHRPAHRAQSDEPHLTGHLRLPWVMVGTVAEEER